jgi:hypothetical protein
MLFKEFNIKHLEISLLINWNLFHDVYLLMLIITSVLIGLGDFIIACNGSTGLYYQLFKFEFTICVKIRAIQRILGFIYRALLSLPFFSGATAFQIRFCCRDRNFGNLNWNWGIRRDSAGCSSGMASSARRSHLGHNCADFSTLRLSRRPHLPSPRNAGRPGSSSVWNSS